MPPRTCLAFLVAATTLLAGPPATTPLSRLSWLTGCWLADGAEPGSGEQWLPPAGGTMFGISRTVKNGQMAFFEFMQLRQQTDGKLLFIAHPAGKDETPFTLVAETPDSFIFENPRSAFPQRIIYQRLPNNRLLGRIEGSVDGKAQSVDFPMTRTPCDVPPPGR